MKNVIIRIRNNKGQIKAKFYYPTQSHFNTYSYKDVCENIQKGDELDVKVGTNYRTFTTYEEVEEEARINETDFEGQMWDWINNNFLKWEIEGYLPRW